MNRNILQIFISNGIAKTAAPQFQVFHNLELEEMFDCGLIYLYRASSPSSSEPLLLSDIGQENTILVRAQMGAVKTAKTRREGVSVGSLNLA